MSPTEDFYVEINLRKKKWLLCLLLQTKQKQHSISHGKPD